MLQLACPCVALLVAHTAAAYSITSVTVSLRDAGGSYMHVLMSVNIATPNQPAFFYAPTRVSSNATGIHIDIFPDSGPLTAIGFLQETVTLGPFPPGTYDYTIVLYPRWGTVGWGEATNRGTFTLRSGSVSPVARIDATAPIAEETSGPLSRPPRAGIFSVSRTGPTNDPLSVFVHYSGTAVRRVDYPDQPRLVTIPAGASSTEIQIVPTPDQVHENIETVVATLSRCPMSFGPDWGVPCVATLIDSDRQSATVFIRDSPGLSVVNVYGTDSCAVEPSSNAPNAVLDTATFRIVRSEPTNDWLEVRYALRGSAYAGIDYENISAGVDRRAHGVVIPPGRSSATVTIQPVADNLMEGFETVVLQLENPPPVGTTNVGGTIEYTVGPQHRAGAVIADNRRPILVRDTSCTAVMDALHITFKASSGHNYRVEASADLIDWQTLSTATATEDTVHFVETDRASLPHRFYRIRLDPAPVTGGDD